MHVFVWDTDLHVSNRLDVRRVEVVGFAALEWRTAGHRQISDGQKIQEIGSARLVVVGTDVGVSGHVRVPAWAAAKARDALFAGSVRAPWFRRW